MMYIIYNHDGSIKEKNLNEFIQQGDNLTKQIAVAIVGYEPSAFALSAVFKLPNGDQEVLTSDTPVLIKEEYPGIVLSLTEDVTALEGVVKMTIRAIENETDRTLTTYVAYLTINEGAEPGTIAMMSLEQYELLISMIHGYVETNETILVLDHTPISTEGFDLGQIVYNITNYKLYELKNNGWTEIFDLTDHYTKAQIDSLLLTKQDELTTDLPTATLQYAIGFDSQGNLRKGQGGGGGGATYTAGNGIDIIDYTISVDTEVIATKEDLSAKEDVSNKTNSLTALSTNTQYPSAKATYDEIQNVREVAEGKCNSFILSYNDTLATVKADITNHNSKVYDADGNDITTDVTNGDYDETVFDNSAFNSQNDAIQAGYPPHYIIFRLEKPNSTDNDYQFVRYGSGIIKRGDIILVVETEVPDRWYGQINYDFFKLETSKVDLTNYYTISQTNGLIADAYSNQATYTVGQYCIYNNTLYRCTTAVGVAEDFDSNKWTACKIADVMVDLDSAQTITGKKTHDANVLIKSNRSLIFGDTETSYITYLAGNQMFYSAVWAHIYRGDIIPFNDNQYDLGCDNNNTGVKYFRNAHIKGKIKDGTNEVSVAQIHNGLYGGYITNSTTVLEYETINDISVSADTTYTLATAPTNTYPEYKANITNSGASDIDLTFTGVSVIKTNDSNITIASNVLTLPAGTTIEVNIQNGNMIAFNWSAN